MALLDEWQVPEPSPYFDTRLGARLREEMARPAAGWLQRVAGWLRRPVWAMSLAAVVFAGALTIGVVGKSYVVQTGTIATALLPWASRSIREPPSAICRHWQNNDELYADFDVLDKLQVQDDVNANPVGFAGNVRPYPIDQLHH